MTLTRVFGTQYHAITEAEKPRQQDFKYFVITWTSFGRLDRYSEFRALLNERFAQYGTMSAY